MAVDGQGTITLFNAAAEGILKLKTASVVGRKVADVLHPNLPLLRTLATGRGYYNQQIAISTSRGLARYLTSGRPLVDDRGNIYGAVASIKDAGQIRALVHSVTRRHCILG